MVHGSILKIGDTVRIVLSDGMTRDYIIRGIIDDRGATKAAAIAGRSVNNHCMFGDFKDMQ